MPRVKSFINGGDFFPADLNNIQDDYETGFAAWRPFPITVHHMLLPADTTGLKVATHDTGVTNASGAMKPYTAAHTYPQSMYDRNGRLVRFRLVTELFNNAIAYTGTLTSDMRNASVSPAFLAGGNATTSPTLGGLSNAATVVGGSSATVTNLAANATARLVADFSAPAAVYCLMAFCLQASASVSTNGIIVARYRLFARMT